MISVGDDDKALSIAKGDGYITQQTHLMSLNYKFTNG